MEVKSFISLANPYKISYVKDRLDSFGKFVDLNFNFQVFTNLEQIIPLIHEKSIDCAIIDAKHCTALESEFLDWFFINMYENCDFDALIYKKKDLPYYKIGVLTTNQWIYCKDRFKGADIFFIKEFKNINELLEDFDVIMLPGCFLNKAISSFNIEKVKIIDLQKPFFEGSSCVVFRNKDERFLFLRQFFIKSVYFIGAGVGDKKYATQEAIYTIKNLEVCLFDNLMDHSLLDFLPENAILIDVGKRCEHHKLNQNKITDLISKYVRMGFRVGRLKGGDPSIFGRLAEEIEVLEDLKINFNIIPGISTINALSLKSGIILTRREINRGFCVLSAIKHKGATAEFSKNEFVNLPLIFFMGVRVIGKISSSLIKEGYPPQTKVALAFNIGTDKEFEVRGTLSDITSKINDLKDQLFFDNPPGIFIVGEISNFYYRKSGLLQDKKVLLPSPVDDELCFNFKDVGANPLIYDLNIKYNINKEALEKIINFQAIAISNIKIAQAIIESLFEQKIDIRALPMLITENDDVFDFFRHYGLQCTKDVDSLSNFNICFVYGHDCCVDLPKTLSNNNKIFKIKLDARMYKQKGLPSFDMIYFNDVEQLYDFVEIYGEISLKDKLILTQNKDTSKLVSNHLANICIFDRLNFKQNIPHILHFFK
ncbi:Uroporphyrinogen-III methyltransferase / Uroporphyrinogen-III synthase [Desulfurella amilsii]|uniref:uroporphyrinogen-III C-methyltransferase n=1 Tax=Desulfurella amilsii TaxID=1562698 RepID=A0A1X4XWH4_9BACT|nr:SAM-dependent methyltransferase [Desulfurella amilsii]OSS41883.1 Uroporphyrinogen-III methyltransferase / Uroporphyrinogen-III synthase [Desulfurella amilsii]